MTLLGYRLVACITGTKPVSVVLSFPVVVMCYGSPRKVTHLCPCVWVQSTGLSPGFQPLPLVPTWFWGKQVPCQDATPLPPSGPVEAPELGTGDPLLPKPGPHHPGLFSNTQLAGAKHTHGAFQNQVYFWSFCQNKKSTKQRRQDKSMGAWGARQRREKAGAVIGRTLCKRQHCDGTRWAGTIRVARQDMGASCMGLQDGGHQASCPNSTQDLQ